MPRCVARAMLLASTNATIMLSATQTLARAGATARADRRCSIPRARPDSAARAAASLRRRRQIVALQRRSTAPAPCVGQDSATRRAVKRPAVRPGRAHKMCCSETRADDWRRLMRGSVAGVGVGLDVSWATRRHENLLRRQASLAAAPAAVRLVDEASRAPRRADPHVVATRATRGAGHLKNPSSCPT